ncbi:hypothetical protein VQ03_00020 [Methylobacterium tarhaniae]|uniref:Uncharacterized protein n=1 Tax=Methylobacterium tarhaniae TaxID=1187852 RepID=A0A0J6TGE7_9HYPH|nr:hypothetical protein VQ03_00020 [Methylobacterium tarhaniae]
MTMKPGLPNQPVVHQRRLVRLQVVENQMHLRIRRNGLLDLIQERAELGATMVAFTPADDRAGLDVEGREQVERPIPAMVVSGSLGVARPQRVGRGRALHRLDPGLLVDAQHQGAAGRSQVELMGASAKVRRRQVGLRQ